MLVDVSLQGAVHSIRNAQTLLLSVCVVYLAAVWQLSPSPITASLRELRDIERMLEVEQPDWYAMLEQNALNLSGQQENAEVVALCIDSTSICLRTDETSTIAPSTLLGSPDQVTADYSSIDGLGERGGLNLQLNSLRNSDPSLSRMMRLWNQLSNVRGLTVIEWPTQVAFAEYRDYYGEWDEDSIGIPYGDELYASESPSLANVTKITLDTQPGRGSPRDYEEIDYSLFSQVGGLSAEDFYNAQSTRGPDGLYAPIGNYYQMVVDSFPEQFRNLEQLNLVTSAVMISMYDEYVPLDVPVFVVIPVQLAYVPFELQKQMITFLGLDTNRIGSFEDAFPALSETTSATPDLPVSETRRMLEQIERLSDDSRLDIAGVSLPGEIISKLGLIAIPCLQILLIATLLHASAWSKQDGLKGELVFEPWIMAGDSGVSLLLRWSVYMLLPIGSIGSFLLQGPGELEWSVVAYAAVFGGIVLAFWSLWLANNYKTYLKGIQSIDMRVDGDQDT